MVHSFTSQYSLCSLDWAQLVMLTLQRHVLHYVYNNNSYLEIVAADSMQSASQGKALALPHYREVRC